MKRIYSLTDIARNWKVTVERVSQIVTSRGIVSDYRTLNREFWDSIPEKPEAIKPGPKSGTRT